jgi:hypothetical protein
MLRSRAASPNRRRRDGGCDSLKNAATELLKRVGDAEHRLAGQLKRAREDANELSADLKRVRRDAATENSRLRKDRDYWRCQSDAMQVEVDGLKNSLSRLSEAHSRQVRRLKSECDDLKAKHAEQGEELAAARTRSEVLVKETTQKLQAETEQAIVDFLRQLSGVFCENGLPYISDDDGAQQEETTTKAEDETFRLQVFTPIEDKRDAKALSDADEAHKEPEEIDNAIPADPSSREEIADVESVSPAASNQ